MSVIPNFINHEALVLDASSSMEHLAPTVIKVTDEHTEFVARRSRDLNQEHRITGYMFNHIVTNMFYDMDALRLPSMKGVYKTSGTTALLKATLVAIEDLEKTYTPYGDHSFLLYVITDGEENASAGSYATRSEAIKWVERLQEKLRSLPPEWTVAILVPNESGKRYALSFGFPAENISVWTTTREGFTEVGNTLQAATDAYMVARSQGNFRGTKSLFTLDTSNLNKTVVQKALQQLERTTYDAFIVTHDVEINEFVAKATGKTYRPSEGKAYYEFTKPEEIQANKEVCIRDKSTGVVYAGTGDQVRQMLGIPLHTTKVRPADHPKYEFFIQSKSWNRVLKAGQNIIVRK